MQGEAPPWRAIIAAIGGGVGAAAIGRLVVDRKILTPQATGIGIALGGTALAFVTDGTARAIGTSMAAVGVGQVALELARERAARIEAPNQRAPTAAADASAAGKAAQPAPSRDAAPRSDVRVDVTVTERADGKVTFAGWKTYDDLYFAQRDYFRRVQGADPVEHLTIGAHAPIKAQGLAGAAKRAIVDLPANLASAAGAVGSGLAGIVRDAASALGAAGAALFGPLHWPLLIGVGLVTLYLLTRSSTHPEEDR